MRKIEKTGRFFYFDVSATKCKLNGRNIHGPSRQIFCVNLVRELFTANERQDSKIKGKRGKKKLDGGMTSYD